jgi:hypothetical protein
MTEWRTTTTPAEDPLPADRRRLWMEAFFAVMTRESGPSAKYAASEADTALAAFDAKFGQQARSEGER